MSHAALGCPGVPGAVLALAAFGFLALCLGVLVAYVAVAEPLVDRVRARRAARP